MSEFLPFIIAGLVSGSVYGLAGSGLVLAYKTTGIFNFAHGAVGTAAAYLFYELRLHGVPWPLALIVATSGTGIVLGLILERIGRRLAKASTAIQILATVGVLLVITGAVALIFGSGYRVTRPFFPTKTLSIFGVFVSIDQLIVVAIAVLLAFALVVFLRSSRLGLAMRGLVSDPDLLALAGTNPDRVRQAAWVIGSSLAALSGILIAPSLSVNPLSLTLLVIQAYGAAAVGAFSSLPGTFGGGLLVGVTAALATRYVTKYPALNAFPVSVPFLVLFAALLVLGKRRLPEVGSLFRGWGGTALPSNRTRAIAGSAALLLGLIVPHVVGVRLVLWSSALIFVLIFLSLGLLVTMSGQISLAHATFVALGATTMSHLTVGVGLPWGIALLLSGLIVALLGAVVAIPAIRVAGLYLALATFGFGILIQNSFYTTGIMFGASAARTVPRPALSGGALGDTGFYYLALAFAAVAWLLVLAVGRSRLGLLLRAMADSPAALYTYGASVNVTRVLVFCLSAAIAGVAGGLLGSTLQVAGVNQFPAFLSLLWLAVLAVCGRDVLVAAPLAALVLGVGPTYLSGLSADWQNLLFGSLAALVAILASRPGQLRSFIHRVSADSSDRAIRSPVAARLVPARAWTRAGVGRGS